MHFFDHFPTENRRENLAEVISRNVQIVHNQDFEIYGQNSGNVILHMLKKFDQIQILILLNREPNRSELGTRLHKARKGEENGPNELLDIGAFFRNFLLRDDDSFRTYVVGGVGPGDIFTVVVVDEEIEEVEEVVDNVAFVVDF
jgi:hypothetical protein